MEEVTLELYEEDLSFIVIEVRYYTSTCCNYRPAFN